MTEEQKQALIEHIETDLELLRNVTLKHCHEVERECVLRDIEVNEIALAALTAQPDNWKQRAEAAEAKQDYFGSLVSKARISADKAMVKFPQPNYVLLKVAEEAGEVVQAGVHYAENRMSWGEVEGEIVQLMAMLIRLVTEGDQVNGITPPESCQDFSPAPAADLMPGEWTNEQCLEFLSIAFRHAEISGDIEMNDIRLAVKMVNAAAPEVE